MIFILRYVFFFFLFTCYLFFPPNSYITRIFTEETFQGCHSGESFSLFLQFLYVWHLVLCFPFSFARMNNNSIEWNFFSESFGARSKMASVIKMPMLVCKWVSTVLIAILNTWIASISSQCLSNNRRLLCREVHVEKIDKRTYFNSILWLSAGSNSDNDNDNDKQQKQQHLTVSSIWILSEPSRLHERLATELTNVHIHTRTQMALKW